MAMRPPVEGTIAQGEEKQIKHYFLTGTKFNGTKSDLGENISCKT